MEEEKPHLVLLDLMLPRTDDIELMTNILDVVKVPVIFLSAYGQEEHVARAFDMRAVYYAVKPFSPTELTARIRAALRRLVKSEPTEPYVLGDLTIEYVERRVTLSGRQVPRAAMEYRMLVELSANAGRVLTYDHLLERVWGEKSIWGRSAHAHHHQQAPSQTGRSRGQPQIHLYRASHRISDAEGRKTEWRTARSSLRCRSRLHS